MGRYQDYMTEKPPMELHSVLENYEVKTLSRISCEVLSSLWGELYEKGLQGFDRGSREEEVGEIIERNAVDMFDRLCEEFGVDVSGHWAVVAPSDSESLRIVKATTSGFVSVVHRTLRYNTRASARLSELKAVRDDSR